MTLLPKVKLKAAVAFPARVDGGTGIDITKSNGSYQFDLDFGDFAPPVASLTDAANQNALLWNKITGAYVLAPVTLLDSTSGISDAPNDGTLYGRKNALWTVVPGATPSDISPLVNGSVAPGVSALYSRGDHVHPTDSSRAPLASPTFTGDPKAPTPAPGDNDTSVATTAFVATKMPLANLAASGVATLTEFSGGQISTQGVLNNSFSVYASPTATATSTVFSAAADYTSLSGSGTVPVASFGATTGSTHTAHVRVNSTFLEDHSTVATEPVALFAFAKKWGGHASQYVFASNIQVVDESAGSGAIIGMEIDVDGKATTTSSLGLGIYARNNGSAFSGQTGILVDSTGANSWNKGLVLTGSFGESGINTVTMTGGAGYAVHMANQQRLAWDGGTPGTARAWIIFNQSTSKFEFYIDGAKVGQIP